MRRSAALLLALALLGGCGQGQKESGTKAAHAVPVTVQVAGGRDVRVVESAVGRILDPRSATVAAEVAARVLWVGVDVGDHVRKGARIVRLDARDYRAATAAAKAEMARLGARIEAQRRLVERYRHLAAEKFVSPTTLDRAEADLAAFRQARNGALARYRKAQLDLEHTLVTAPLDGRLQRRFVAVGDYVKKGAPLVEIVTEGPLQISIPFPETKARLIRTGQEVFMHLPGDGRVIRARIHELSPMVGKGSGAFRARIDVPNPGGWRPGGSVVAEVVVARRHAVVVPEESVVLRPQGEVVYVVSGTRVAERPVHTGVRLDGRIEVRSGLHAGETVAVEGAAFLSDGAAVRIVAR